LISSIGGFRRREYKPKQRLKTDLVYIRVMIQPPAGVARLKCKPNPWQRQIWFTLDLDPDPGGRCPPEM